MTPAPDVPQVGAPLTLPASYVLAWADEFDAPGVPSPNHWRHDTGRNRLGWYNGERQYYAHADGSSARVSHGKLVIEARATPPSGPPSDWGGQGYTSARLTTAGRASWFRGFFQVRARMPVARGAWPAIWLLPERHAFRWDGGEIDIAELVGHRPNHVHQGIQTRDANFRRGNQHEGVTRLEDPGSFHDYQLLWTPDIVVFGIDGRVTYAAAAAWFDRPMALIVNLAVGGDWAGSEGIDDAAFPAQLEIESVRVWQAPRKLRKASTPRSGKS